MGLGAKCSGLVLLIGLAAGAAWSSEIAVLNNGFSIRFDHRTAASPNTRLYLGPANDSYVDVPTAQIVRFEKDNTPAEIIPSPATISDTAAAVSTASARHQVDSDFITSVIHAESSYNPHAVSPKGAEGLMQLMPGTASKLGVENPFDPAANVEGGTRYLRQLLDYYHGDMAKTLAAYNAGPHRVARYQGVPPYRETHAYVARVIREYNRKKLAEQRAQAARKKAASRNGNRQTVSNPARVPGHPVQKQTGTGS
ncbi:MAG TPA: lytic transglycosylase domain-containing protein [Terriglobales bacterium]|nr:lytic transglycosylase domain-containing protein [Terriglobales bacterium]